MELDKIITGDSAVVLQSFPPDCIDLTVTSPPYDNLRTYNGFVFDFETIAKQLFRVTKAGGVVVWVVADATVDGSETGTSFRQALRFKEIGFRLHDTMIYERNGLTYPETNRYFPTFEYMFVLSRGKPCKTNLIADKLNSCAGQSMASDTKRNVDGTVSRTSSAKKGALVKQTSVRGNVWRYNVGYMKAT